MDVFLHSGGVQSGPFQLEAVHQMAALGALSDDTQAWYEGRSEWVPVRTFLETHPLRRPVAASRPAPSEAPDGGFFARLPDAFVYPFRGNGKFLLMAGAFFFVVLDFLSSLPSFFSLLVSVFSTGYLCACMQGLITSSAMGENQMPAWPDFSDFLEDIIMPFFQYTVTVTLCLWPVFFMGGVFLASAAKGTFDRSLVLPLSIFALLGLAYLPMALLGVAMAGSISGLNPLVLVPTVLKIPLQYLVACLILLFCVGSAMFLDGLLLRVGIPLLPRLLSGFISLYLLVVEMRVLGLLYHSNRDQLRWV